jgi:multimeric flavodoxin WrbA
MKYVLGLNGSPRICGNSYLLMEEFLAGAKSKQAITECVNLKNVNIEFCQGCLRCNLLKCCAIRNDDWSMLSEKIQQADCLVFASPVYFYSVSAQLKKVLERFRSFIHIQVKPDQLLHQPWKIWNKQIIVILSQGAPNPSEALLVKKVFEKTMGFFLQSMPIQFIIGCGLVTSGQVAMTLPELQKLYAKLSLPIEKAAIDYQRNQQLMNNCFALGEKVVQP